MKTGRNRGLARVEALFAIGTRCLEVKDFPEAEEAFRQALRLAPDRPEAHINLGATLERSGASLEAETCYRRALSLNPSDLQAHLNLGALLVNQKRFGEAELVYEGATRLHPDSAALCSNRGVLQVCLHHEDEAERCFRQALALDATHPKARFNLSYLLLRQGRLDEGWQALEARAWNVELLSRIPAPRWQGESLTGTSLLIGCEGGYGDMIQFSRYVPVLKRQGATRIGIVCHPPLKRLFATLPGIDVVVAMGETIPSPDWDFWTLPQSLPLHCGTQLDTIPAPIPYLRATPEAVSEWRSRLPHRGLRVGLAWQGNPQFENDSDRSLPRLDLLAPLTAVGCAPFISLQITGDGSAASLPPNGLDLFDPNPWIRDFADTAALVTNLDLVISVDTAVAHLAGALGTPCWILLPHHKTDWRWFKERQDSPWYPGSMRLFRQPDTEDWGPVIEAVAAALKQFSQDQPRTRLPLAPQG
jgi:Flp pilus assembly protein TadD